MKITKNMKAISRINAKLADCLKKTQMPCHGYARND